MKRGRLKSPNFVKLSRSPGSSSFRSNIDFQSVKILKKPRLINFVGQVQDDVLYPFETASFFFL